MIKFHLESNGFFGIKRGHPSPSFGVLFHAIALFHISLFLGMGLGPGNKPFLTIYTVIKGGGL